MFGEVVAEEGVDKAVAAADALEETAIGVEVLVDLDNHATTSCSNFR